eukprot:TRINITY_DN63095_c0_g1_i1.p1 TRINITY_DN63095_c0_g1~~TRINITY_DN63095_c0_g1_i1.p1  ORF type:complete len:507 (-),score=-0.91 TRINITY_DN63095_c0_g1_i1:74-1594(-)
MSYTGGPPTSPPSSSAPPPSAHSSSGPGGRGGRSTGGRGSTGRGGGRGPPPPPTTTTTTTAGPPRTTTVAVAKIMRPCRSGFVCKDPACRYQHPCKYGITCRSIPRDNPDEPHRQEFLHPCPMGTSCTQQDDPAHQKLNLQHFPLVPSSCRNGLKCKDPTCWRFHPCKHGGDCTYLRGDQDNNARIHRESYSHPCPKGPTCPQIKRLPAQEAEIHCALFTHDEPVQEKGKTACRYGADCRLMQDRAHVERYLHPCRYLGNCRHVEKYSKASKGDADFKKLRGHLDRWTHPCPSGSSCPLKGDDEHSRWFTHEHQVITSKYPPEWDAVTSKYSECLVNPKSAEYAKIAARFQESMPSTIVKIVRVQNVLLWEKHYWAVELMKKKACNAGNPNYHYVFHGTRSLPAANSVAQSGFNSQRANSNPYGIWFANDASYSCGGYQWAEDGCKTVFVARVAVGTEGTDDGSGRRCTALPSGELPDTHISNQKCKVFVVYDHDLCYPEYKLFFN